MKVYFFQIFNCFILLSILQESYLILLFTEKSELYYNQPKTYILDLKDILKKNGDNILGSIIFISVNNEKEENTKIKLLAKLNSNPDIDSYDHSDFNGINGIYIFYILFSLWV